MTDFAGVKAEFQRLKAQFDAGGLTEAEFKAQLEELMIEDEQGRWWIIGYETGRWYVHDGEQWVQQEPPGATPSPPPARPRYPEAAGLAPDSQPASTPAAPSRTLMGLKLERDTVSVLLITAGWFVFWGAVGLLSPVEFHGGLLTLTILAITGLIGGLITGLVLRRTTPPSPWKQVLVVALGWALGWGIAGVVGYELPISGAAGGLVGGFITALALKWTHPSIQWKHVALVTLGWGIGWAVGGAISGSIVPRYYGSVTAILRYALWAGIGAGAGSWVMFRQLREASQSSP